MATATFPLRADLHAHGLSETILETFRILRTHDKELGCIPSIGYLARIRRLSDRQIQRHLSALERVGMLMKQVRYRWNGSQASNRYVLRAEAMPKCHPDVTPLSETDQSYKKTTQNTQTERLPRSAERAAPAVPRVALSLEPVRQAMEEAQKDISSEPTMVTTRSAEQMVRRLEDAFQRPVSVQEAVQRVREVWEHGKRLKRWRRRGKSKAWLYVGGMLTFAYNLFAEPGRQTPAYRPESYLPSPSTFVTRTSFHCAAVEILEVE